MGTVVRSFPPIVDERSNVLVLGTLPSTQSLIRGQYYGNPHNDFWRIIGDACGVNLVNAPYERRIGILQERNIALWDVLKQGTRDGSKDDTIREPVANDIATFLHEYPRVRRLLFNGRTAYDQFIELVRLDITHEGGIRLVQLQSTSPANRRNSEERAKRWRDALLEEK